MKLLRLVLAGCFVIQGWSFVQASESLEYRAGRAAAYIDYCVKYHLSMELHKKYGHHQA